MSDPDQIQFGSHLIFVDESSDHGLSRVDPAYPIFVWAFCLISKEDYITRISPALQRIKLHFWGHDEQVLHEHEVRKPNKNYSFLFKPEKREEFLEALSQFVDEMPFRLVTSVIRKLELNPTLCAARESLRLVSSVRANGFTWNWGRVGKWIGLRTEFLMTGMDRA